MISSFEYLGDVEGWLEPPALHFTSFFVSTFLASTPFDSLEIGVHHGKFFIGIEQLTPAQNRAVAIDCFSQQQFNIDGSGRGNLPIFLDNCNKFAAHPERVIPLEIDSLNVDCEKLGIGKFGVISVDGCHTERHTINDLEIAERLLAPKGIVILDDILNQDWMGVVSGASKFFSTPRVLSPFAVGFNKLFCCLTSDRQSVQQTVMSSGHTLNTYGIPLRKYTEFMGTPIISMV
jgi:hypothetical protein